MSLAMPGKDGSTFDSMGASLMSLRSLASEALTTTTPATWSARSSASRSTSVPPIDRPIANTVSHRPRRSSNARSTSPYQSDQRVLFMSCQRVPCPGRRGALTVRPAAARCSAQGRIDCVVPVKPWLSRTPTGPPGRSMGSAPGSTANAEHLSWDGPNMVARLRSGPAVAPGSQDP
jgi:hypothetical protein